MRHLLASLIGGWLLLVPALAHADHAPRHMVVSKTPGCECCTAWADVARRAGYEVTVTEREDMSSFKKSVGVSETVASCHTTLIDGYVVEGHVPMEAVAKLLSERPSVAGIAAPGMPAGSPGMGDDPAARFDVLTFSADGKPGDVYYRAGPVE